MQIIFNNASQVYAYRTTVTPANTIAAIRKMLEKYNCKGWAEIESPDNDTHIIQFQIPISENEYRTVQFELIKVFLKNKRGIRYLKNESYRLLYQTIKIKLQLARITNDFFGSFMPNLLLKNNKTLEKAISEDNTLLLSE